MVPFQTTEVEIHFNSFRVKDVRAGETFKFTHPTTGKSHIALCNSIVRDPGTAKTIIVATHFVK